MQLKIEKIEGKTKKNNKNKNSCVGGFESICVHNKSLRTDVHSDYLICGKRQSSIVGQELAFFFSKILTIESLFYLFCVLCFMK